MTGNVGNSVPLRHVNNIKTKATVKAGMITLNTFSAIVFDLKSFAVTGLPH